MSDGRLDPKFCPFCGQPLKMRYAGGDPENGPALPRCKDESHPMVEEFAYGRYSTDYVTEYLQEIKQGGYDPSEPVPDELRLAASVLLKDIEKQG